MSRALSLVAALAIALATAASARAQEAPALPALGADPAGISISGLSSGGYMAVQFGVAWSSIVKGVGVIAGGPFFCAQATPGRTPDSGSLASIETATSTCMTALPLPPDVPTLVKATDGFARSGLIDDPANVKGQKIYLFSGYNDNIVVRPVMDALQSYYAHYMTPSGMGNLFYQTAIGAGHAQVTAGYGSACPENGGHYINDCGYDQAGILLQHIYGALQPKTPTGQLGGQVLAFTQRDFVGDGVVPPKTFGLAETGYAYVPASCRHLRCRVHVALHGCLQNAETIGQDYILHAGYNEWADSNGIIVLYPQTTATNVVPDLDPTAPLNPKGCWDWFGYTDSTYATQQGAQIGAIKAMLDRLTAARPPGATATVPAGPAAPTALQAIDRSDTGIDLAWAAAPGAPAYDVFRRAAGQEFVRIGSASGASFADSGLSPQTAYTYGLAPAGVGQPAASTLVTMATLPTPPRCGDPGHCRLP
jgi:poly(3-hydroxybutyrate) depolymerase